jgi:drug/metabolite transporter (DMT)-like permease
MSKQVRADGILLFVTLCWGVSYYLMDISLGELDPFTLNTFRFLGAFAIAAIFSWKKIKSVNKTTLKYSLLVGIALVVVYIGATFGVKYTSLSNSGFLCALTVIFTPILNKIFFKKSTDKKSVVVIIMCFIGIALMTLKDDFSINMENLKGDLLCLMCAVAYAIDLILTEKAVSKENVDAYQLGVFQLGVTGLCNLILSFIFETPQFPETPKIWGSVLFLTIFCTGIAFILQPIAQQYTTAAHVGVIFTLEPVFAAIVAFAFANEVLTAKAYLGAAIMIISILVMEVDVKGIWKKLVGVR